MKNFYSQNKHTIIGYLFIVVCSFIFTIPLNNLLESHRILTAQCYFLFVWDVKIYLIYIVKNMFFLWGIITAIYTLFLFILPMYAKIKFKKHVPLVKKAINESEALRNPLTLFTDNQLVNFKKEQEETYRCSQKRLWKFLKEEGVKDDTRKFTLRYSKIDETKKWNNKWYDEIKRLKEYISFFNKESLRVMDEEHYFTGSEKDYISSFHNTLLGKYNEIRYGV